MSIVRADVESADSEDDSAAGVASAVDGCVSGTDPRLR